jgi:hypothetical protein
MSGWSAITWDVARAGGLTAYILLSLSVAVGLALSLHWQTPRWPRLLNSELHNYLSLISLVFVGVHILAVWLDPFTQFGWQEILLPFTSHYRPLWMAMGIVALYLGLAIGLSTWLRQVIGYRWWRRLHVATLGIYALSTLHGLAMGSDTRAGWGALIYVGSILLVGTPLALRLLVPARGEQPRLAPVAGLAVALVLGTIWAVAGPLRPGWNTIANNGNGSGARTALAAGSSSGSGDASGQASDPFATAFSATVRGTLTQGTADAAGNVTIQLNMTLSGGAAGSLQVQLHGQQATGWDDQPGDITIASTNVTLSTSGATRYTGTITRLRASGQWRVSAQLTNAGNSAQALQLRLALQVDDTGQISGDAAGTPMSGSGGGSNSGGTTPVPGGGSTTIN